MLTFKYAKRLGADKGRLTPNGNYLRKQMNSRENQLYEPVIKWFAHLLSGKFRNSEVKVYDTHSIYLSSLVERLQLQKNFPAFNAFDIKVDVTGVIKKASSCYLAFIECKVKLIKLLDVGQLLGYSKVAKPIFSALLSPVGVSSALLSLLRTFGRYDILEYDNGKRIKILTWDESKEDIDTGKSLPPGEFFF